MDRRFGSLGLERALLLAVILVAAAVRLWHLGAQSLWFDEAYGLGTAQGALSTLFHRVAVREGTPPLFFLMVYPLVALHLTSEYALRLPSVVFGVLSVILVYALGKRLLGRSAGLTAAGLMAISPFQVYLSQEARAFSLLGLLTLASYLLLLVALERRRTHLWALYAVVCALAFYTHYYALFTWLGQVAYVAWRARRERAILKPWLAATAATAVLSSPWLIVFLRTLATVRGTGAHAWRPDVGWLMVPYTFFQFSLGFTTAKIRSVSDLAPHLPVLLAGTLAFGVPFAIGLWYLRRERPQAALLIAYLVVPLAAVLTVDRWLKIYAPVYLAGVLPAYLLIVAVGLVRMRPRAAGAVSAAAIGACAVLALHGLYYDARFQKEPWRVIARTIAGNSRPTDVILFHKSYLQTPFSHYYRGRLDETPLPDRAATVETEAQRLVSRIMQGHGRAWLILGHNADTRGGYPSLLGQRFRLVNHTRYPGLVPISVYLYEIPAVRGELAARQGETSQRSPHPSASGRKS